MNAAAFLAAAETLALVGLDEIVGPGGLVVVAPHPDDETLGCGGLIAAACAAGLPVRVLVLSDGAGSHPNSRKWSPEHLRDLRETETRGAAEALGLDTAAVRFLRLPDRFVSSSGSEGDGAARCIADTCRTISASAVCVTWRHDPHADHQAAARLVDAARVHVGPLRVFEFPIWGWNLPPDYDVGAPPFGCRFDIGGHLAQKLRGIAAHRSQTTALIDDDPGGFRVDPAMLARFSRPYEIFLHAGPLR